MSLKSNLSLQDKLELQDSPASSHKLSAKCTRRCFLQRLVRPLPKHLDNARRVLTAPGKIMRLHECTTYDLALWACSCQYCIMCLRASTIVVLVGFWQLSVTEVLSLHSIAVYPHGICTAVDVLYSRQQSVVLSQWKSGAQVWCGICTVSITRCAGVQICQCCCNAVASFCRHFSTNDIKLTQSWRRSGRSLNLIHGAWALVTWIQSHPIPRY